MRFTNTCGVEFCIKQRQPAVPGFCVTDLSLAAGQAVYQSTQICFYRQWRILYPNILSCCVRMTAIREFGKWRKRSLNTSAIIANEVVITSQATTVPIFHFSRKNCWSCTAFSDPAGSRSRTSFLLMWFKDIPHVTTLPSSRTRKRLWGLVVASV